DRFSSDADDISSSLGDGQLCPFFRIDGDKLSIAVKAHCYRAAGLFYPDHRCISSGEDRGVCSHHGVILFIDPSFGTDVWRSQEAFQGLSKTQSRRSTVFLWTLNFGFW